MPFLFFVFFNGAQIGRVLRKLVRAILHDDIKMSCKRVQSKRTLVCVSFMNNRFRSIFPEL